MNGFYSSWHLRPAIGCRPSPEVLDEYSDAKRFFLIFLLGWCPETPGSSECGSLVCLGLFCCALPASGGILRVV